MILETATNECPVSLLDDANIKPGAEDPKQLVQLFARAKAMYEVVGATHYGPDLNKWPAKLVDAFVIIQKEHTKVESMKLVKK